MADLRGGGDARDARPWGSKFFHFLAVFGKNLQNNPTSGVGAPPRENAISATVYYSSYLSSTDANSFYVRVLLFSYICPRDQYDRNIHSLALSPLGFIDLGNDL